MQTHLNRGKNEAQITNVQLAQPSSESLGVAPAELQQTLNLAGLLQTSLEVETVLKYFVEAALQRVEFDSVQFEYTPLACQFVHGQKKRHTCSYRLKLAGEFLGELIFSRRQRFAEAEMETLEGLLGQLIYPIRNAIWYQRAVQSAQMDPLTGIYNRTAMDNMLQREVDLAHRNRTPLSLIVADIDHFKKINDQHGHSVGDAVLKEFSEIVSDNLRGSDVVFRYGGEEFVVLLTGTNSEDVELVANRIRKAVAEHVFCAEDLKLPLTASFGTASLNSADTPESLFNKADSALYQAKETGRNRICMFQQASGLKQVQLAE